MTKINLVVKFSILSMIISMNHCIPYLYHLGKEQVRIMSKREKLSELVQKKDIDTQLKKKLQLVEELRKFAIRQLYLNPKGGFEYFVQLDREAVGWHVTASYPLKFESYTWWFPIVGSVPYKGYFSKQPAIAAEEELKKKGLDTRLRITAGYSTLGWFSDPLFSTQITENEYELVSLIFHEMAHATVYINGDSLFNESFASFIEDIGVQNYYTSMNTPEANQQLSEYLKLKTTNSFLLSEIRTTAMLLHTMYESELTDAEKKIEKKKLIELFKDKIIQNSQNLSEEKIKKFRERELNNEDFIGILRYNSGEAFFQQKFEAVNRNFSEFYTEMQKLEKLEENARKELVLGKPVPTSSDQ
jgi:predicted aminopeptidase